MFTPEHPEFIGRLNHALLATHWERYYTLPNMVLVAVGDTTMSRMCDAADRVFRASVRDKAAQRIMIPPIPASPTMCGELHLDCAAIFGVERQSDGDITIKLCSVTSPNARPYETTSVAMQVLSEAAFEELRERRGLVYSVDVGVAAFRDLWTHEVGMVFARNRYDAVLRAFRGLPQLLSGDGRAIFSDVKNRLAARFLLRDKKLEEAVDDAVDNIAAFGRIESRRAVRRAVAAVTFQDVCHTVDQLFAGNRTLTVVLYP